MNMDKSRDYMQYLFTLGKNVNTILILMTVHQDIFIYKMHIYVYVQKHIRMHICVAYKHIHIHKISGKFFPVKF